MEAMMRIGLTKREEIAMRLLECGKARDPHAAFLLADKFLAQSAKPSESRPDDAGAAERLFARLTGSPANLRMPMEQGDAKPWHKC